MLGSASRRLDARIQPLLFNVVVYTNLSLYYKNIKHQLCGFCPFSAIVEFPFEKGEFRFKPKFYSGKK